MIAESPNRLLASLPAAMYRSLLPTLQTVHLGHGEALPSCGQSRVFFPGTGVCSVGVSMSDGRAIEVALVGREGVVGMSSGSHRQPPVAKHTYVQVGDGSAQWIAADALDRFLSANEPFRTILDRYSRVFLRDMMRSAACNRLHTMEQRCASWFLSAADRLGRTQFEVSQRFLAGALGVKPSTFAVIARSLSKKRVIEWDGERLAILHRRRLQKLACSCHQRRGSDFRSMVPGEGDAATTVSHKVVKLLPDVVCDLCHSSSGLPHLTHHQCVAEVDRQIRSLYDRQRELTQLRHQLVGTRLKVVRAFLERAKLKAAGGGNSTEGRAAESVPDN